MNNNEKDNKVIHRLNFPENSSPSFLELYPQEQQPMSQLE